MDKGIRRRDFFKALAAGGAAGTALAACQQPQEKLIPYLLPPDNVEFAPGQPLAYATTCTECPANCGMVVQTREGRAIKAEGNPDHPLNQGKLCIRGQASLQTHYNPARLTSAMQRSSGTWEPMEWAAAEQAFADALSSVSDPSQIALITGNAAGTRGSFLDAWLEALGAPAKVVFEALGQHNIREANRRTFNRAEVPQYRIEAAELLLNFGAEFLETWQAPTQYGRQFTAMHAYDEATGSKGRFVHVGPHNGLTAANADDWLNVTPGSEAVVALAMAREVLEANGQRLSNGEREQLSDYLEPFTLERAAEASGIAAERLRRLARDFAGSTSLALGGGNLTASSEGTRTQIAVNLLNYVAGNVGETVLFGANRQIDLSSPFSEVAALVERMRAGEIQVLIVDGANPAYHLPPGTGIAEALDNVPTIVSLSSAWDETTVRAHLALPGRTFLERWGDAFPEAGVYNLQQPVMAPVYAVKAAEDTLLSVAQRLELEAFADVASYKAYLQAAWQRVQEDTGNADPFELFWRQALQRGGVFGNVSFSTNVRLNPDALAEAPGEPALQGEGLVLLPTPSLKLYDGRGASNPWLQEIPDPISQVVWDSWADINPEAAREMGIGHGDLIRLTSPVGSVELPAYYHYGVNRGAVAVSLGQGHTDSGRNADMRGVNIMQVLPAQTDALSGAFAFLSTRVQVEKVSSRAYMVQMDGSPRQMEREIIQTQTLEQARAGEAPETGLHHGELAHHHDTSFYPPREEQTPGYYQTYRWGMTVDADRCTGCSACVAACYAENNIAVVGKERMGLGREMAWLTIQRYWEGEGDDYRTLMQPMFCQHCGNAGCEPVCPVYATYHNPDGLNAQIYNRCVGTRYCSNNCAYKVRRFNWFNYEWESPLHYQLNPDVTVRSKGVMEKCTFCVQRIHRARRNANDQGRDLQDGEVTPACVQTCPTDALTFGNLEDPDSQVARKALRRRQDAGERVRQYEVLPELRQRPAVTYLRKVTFEPIKEA